MSGSAFVHEGARNVVHAATGQVVLYGVSDLVVVTRDGLTLVTTREHSADLKRLIEALPPEMRTPAPSFAPPAEAQLIADELPLRAEAQSWRGFGVIRVGVGSKKETKTLIEAVSRSFNEHSLKWARVRYDDEERVFKSNGNAHRAA